MDPTVAQEYLTVHVVKRESKKQKRERFRKEQDSKRLTEAVAMTGGQGGLITATQRRNAREQHNKEFQARIKIRAAARRYLSRPAEQIEFRQKKRCVLAIQKVGTCNPNPSTCRCFWAHF